MKQVIIAIALTSCLTAQAKSGKKVVSAFLRPARSEIRKGNVGAQLAKA